MNTITNEKEQQEINLAKFKVKYDKLLLRCQNLEQKLLQNIEKNKFLSEENFSLNYLLQNEKNKNTGYVENISRSKIFFLFRPR